MLQDLEGYIDVRATQKNMKKLLSKYRTLSMVIGERREPSITQSFSGVPASTNKILNSIEAAADQNIKREKMLNERAQMKEIIDEAVSNLDEDEQYIIKENMIKKEKVADVFIYTDLHINKTKYYKLKQQSLIKLAISLGIEVYKK